LIDINHARVDFVSPWFITKASDHFHNNFQARLKAYPLGYRGDNFKFTTMAQRKAKQQTREKQQE
jgi:hypothetical protein